MNSILCLLFLLMGAACANSQNFDTTPKPPTIKKNTLNCVKAAFEPSVPCFSRLLNYPIIFQEIHMAKQNGTVDEVFKKYCNKTKSPEYKMCFADFSEAVRPCFSKEAPIRVDFVEKLIEFACRDEGDRLALLVAEGGQECIQMKSIEVQACFNSTIGQSDLMKIDNKIDLNENNCNTLNAFKNCTVNKLEGCKQMTTANIVDSLFNFVKKNSPCDKYSMMKPIAVKSSAPFAVFTSAATVLITILINYLG